jgi:hypothetical protein
MSSAVINSAIRAVQGSAEFLNTQAKLLARAEQADQIVAVADHLEVEIERMRTLILLLRHDARREASVAQTAGAAETVR